MGADVIWLLIIVVGLLVLAHHGPGALGIVLKRTIYAFLILAGGTIGIVLLANALLTVRP